MTSNSADVLDAVVERHLTVFGKTGSGKTYAAKGIVERLLSAAAGSASLIRRVSGGD